MAERRKAIKAPESTQERERENGYWDARYGLPCRPSSLVYLDGYREGTSVYRMINALPREVRAPLLVRSSTDVV